MPFDDIACHVWAIDGYTTDEVAAAVNTCYSETAAGLQTANNSAARQAAVTALMACRAGAATDLDCRVYGGFRRGQKAPEHMWVEYDGFIYDTMPGRKLVRVVADDQTRTCPGCENDDFGTGAVSVATKLTASQRDAIAAVPADA